MKEIETEITVCVSCLAPTDGSAAFCQSCQAPLGTTSALDPVKTIHAEAFVLQKAVSTKPKPIVLFGVWVLFFPLFLGSVAFAVNELINGSGVASIIFSWVGIALAFVAVKFLYMVTKNYLTNTP